MLFLKNSLLKKNSLQLASNIKSTNLGLIAH